MSARTTAHERRHKPAAHQPATPKAPARPRRWWPLWVVLAVLAVVSAYLSSDMEFTSGKSSKSRDYAAPTNYQTFTQQDSSARSAAQSAKSTDGFPALTGRVVDQAGVLGPAAAGLAAKLAALEEKTTDQLVVATVPSLNGDSVEEYANRLFRHWGIGQKIKNNGVLLLIAPNERKIRIEVGYGLEGTLTDAISKLIITNAIAPRLKANDMAGGVEHGVDDIIKVLTGDAEEWKNRAAPASGLTSAVTDGAAGALAAAGKFLVVFLFLGVFALFFGAMGFVLITLLVNFLVWIHLLPKHDDRGPFWAWLNFFDSGKTAKSGSSRSYGSSDSSWSSSSGSSSSSSDSFSGGGGDSGGGGASGDY